MLGELDLGGVLIQAVGAPHPEAVFHQLQEQGADFLLTVKGNQKTLHRQIRHQFQGKRHIPFMACDHEISHGRSITWTQLGTAFAVVVVLTGGAFAGAGIFIFTRRELAAPQ